MIEKFNIPLAPGIKVTVTPFLLDDDNVIYQISTGDKVHGFVIPIIDDDMGIVWKANGNIDDKLIPIIGKMIERHNL